MLKANSLLLGQSVGAMVLSGTIEYVKCILRKYGYPPDLQEKATDTVLEQAEVLSGVWVVA